MSLSRRPGITAWIVFILTAMCFIDIGYGLIFGASVFSLMGGVDSPLAVALADGIASGNALIFFTVVAFLILFTAYLLYISADLAFRHRGGKP